LFCQKCGKEIPEGSSYCPYCGQKATSGDSFSPSVIKDEEYRDYIGPRAYNYMEKFNKFNRSGMDRFVFTWHWPAFFIGFWWLLYRKMYFWSLIAFGVWWLPHLALPGMFIWGAVGHYLYYLQAKRKISDYRIRSSTALPAITLAEIGGVNRWVWILAVLFAVLIGAALILGGVFLYHLFREFLNWPEYLEV
jgi:hypothetical protein